MKRGTRQLMKGLQKRRMLYGGSILGKRKQMAATLRQRKHEQGSKTVRENIKKL